MAVTPMSYSPATLLREYQLIGTTSIAERAVSIYLHNEKHHAAAVYAEPEDVDGQLRHIVIGKIDLKTRRSEDDNETILAVIGYFESSLVESLQVEGVIVTKRERGATLATVMYQALIDTGIVLVSDNVQYPGGKALWSKIARNNAFDVFVFDAEQRQFWPYDGERVRYDGVSIPESEIWSLAPDESRKGVVLVAEGHHD
ncbi:TPA: hypothetical protein O3H02_004295 [Salmonella enterica subsp. enterica serovar Saintpaul str. CFSAN004144]|nr:hypothetical protein [Salmonella enterica subsp. enterica serovar Saintpaul str. CFSAN004144]